jgi:glutathione-regulated potassium-efflux system ancillary protein KefG
MQKTLVILAHPNMKESRLNKAMLQAVADLPHVTVHDLYSLYKSAEFIDVTKEQELLLCHDRIVFQFPLYWYSSPGLLKDWQDKVLEYGFAYGHDGDKLANKEFKLATTTGSPECAYQAGAYMHFTMSEILKPFETMALFTRMVFTPTFAIHRALKITDEELHKKAAEYKTVLCNEDWGSSLEKYLSE